MISKGSHLLRGIIYFYSKILLMLHFAVPFFFLLNSCLIIILYIELQTLAWFSCRLPCPKLLVKY